MTNIGSNTGLTAAKARAAIVKPPEKEMTKIALEEDLAFLLNNNFSRGQYKAVRAKSKGDEADIGPSYQYGFDGSGSHHMWPQGNAARC